jgi:hypothetical protein
LRVKDLTKGNIVVFVVAGKVWIKQMVISASLLPTVICGTAFFINFIAIYYHASRAIPLGTMVRRKEITN